MSRRSLRCLAAAYAALAVASSNPPISVTKLNQFPKARKRVFPAFARRHTGHSGITQQFGFGGFRPGPRPRPEAAYLGRRGAAAVESGGLVIAANREESLEEISTRGGERPAEVVSGDMMALRPVGATIGPADLARLEQNCDFAAAPARAGGIGAACGAAIGAFCWERMR